MGLDGIKLDKSRDTPLYRQLADNLHALITNGQLPSGAKLPPIRALAKRFAVNNATVINAYKYLESLRCVHSVVGSGTYVSDAHKTPPDAQGFDGDISGYINFADTSTMPSLYPVDAFKQAFGEVLNRDGAAAFKEQDGRGCEPLRESLCALLHTMSVTASPGHIRVITGVQQGLDIAAKALFNPGDALLAESPTNYGGVGIFAARGAKTINIPLEPHGPDPRQLERLLKKHRPKAMYLMPHFQNPTGISYSDGVKRKVLELAYKYGTYIIEEDSQNDFYYDNRRRIPLKALDDNSRVIYVKSLSKILMPGLGLGFMVCPEGLSMAGRSDDAVSGYVQRAVDLFLRSGGFESHGKHMRAVYGRRYRKVISEMENNLREHATYTAPGGGLNIWLTVNRAAPAQTEALCGRLLQRKVIVSPGALFTPQGSDLPCFRVSFAAVAESAISEGIGIIASEIAGGLWKNE
jgi:DNA-binding transcriptional MocR family regulator